MMLTVVILSLFLISATVFSGYAVRKSVQERVSSVTDFVVSVEEDLPRMMFVFGFRAVYLEQVEIVSSGYIDDFPEFFEEAFFNETINGGASLETQEILEGSTYEDIITEFNERGSKLGVVVNFSEPHINISQDDPWNLKVLFSANFTASDANGLVSWNKTMEIVKYISIQNFTDPLYVRNTNGEFNQRIVQSPYRVPFSDNSELSDQVDNAYYVNVNDAPSFIDRIEGDISATGPNGIESLVDLDDLPDWVDRKQKSMVDHHYFSNVAYTDTCSGLSSLPSWFEIDRDKLVNTYGLTCP
ncbi:MAG: hypothetical protein KC506_02075 [Nanoarchaeota archaeon]|nr:hypothetical protein [Nanoarchaeota archaeon]